MAYGGYLTPAMRSILSAIQNNSGVQNVPIKSGYRSPEQNRAAGGAGKSQHLDGNAIDIDTSNMSNAEKQAVLAAAAEAGARGFGIYKSGNTIHIDARPNFTVWGPGKRAYKGVSVADLPSWARAILAPVAAGKPVPKGYDIPRPPADIPNVASAADIPTPQARPVAFSLAPYDPNTDFGPPVWNGVSDSDLRASVSPVERGPDLAAALDPGGLGFRPGVTAADFPGQPTPSPASLYAAYDRPSDPLAGVQASYTPPPSDPVTQALNAALFSPAPLGPGQSFGSFSPLPSSFSVPQPPAPPPSGYASSAGLYRDYDTQNSGWGQGLPVQSQPDFSVPTPTYSPPPARDTYFGPTPVAQPAPAPAPRPVEAPPAPAPALQSAVSMPKALGSYDMRGGLAAANAADAQAQQQAKLSAEYQPPPLRDIMFGPVPAAAPDVKVELPPEVPAPVVAAPKPVQKPRLAPLPPPKVVRTIAPGPTSQNPMGVQNQNTDPGTALREAFGKPGDFMSSANFKEGVDRLSALSPDAKTYASLLGDPRLGTVAWNALQNEYAKATGQPGTIGIFEGLSRDMGQAFGNLNPFSYFPTLSELNPWSQSASYADNMGWNDTRAPAYGGFGVNGYTDQPGMAAQFGVDNTGYSGGLYGGQSIGINGPYGGGWGGAYNSGTSGGWGSSMTPAANSIAHSVGLD